MRILQASTLPLEKLQGGVDRADRYGVRLEKCAHVREQCMAALQVLLVMHVRPCQRSLLQDVLNWSDTHLNYMMKSMARALLRQWCARGVARQRFVLGFNFLPGDALTPSAPVLPGRALRTHTRREPG